MNFREDGELGDGATVLVAPLGPIDQYDHWVRVPDGPYNHEGWDIKATWYTDKYRNEYNSVEHVLRCAIAKELGLVV